MDSTDGINHDGGEDETRVMAVKVCMGSIMRVHMVLTTDYDGIYWRS